MIEVQALAALAAIDSKVGDVAASAWRARRWAPLGALGAFALATVARDFAGRWVRR